MDLMRRLEELAPSSVKLFAAAKGVLAGGMAHDLRWPLPIAIERASGALKWDLDGNVYTDYLMGLGALLLGHAHPDVTRAVRDQAARGTNHGAAHTAEVEWAELVCEMVPSAERVRFCSSGTEAVLLAGRVARAYTGRPKIVRFDLHYHGWSEIGVVGLSEPVADPVPGADPAAGVVSIPPSDEDALDGLLCSGEVAAVVLEPTGSRFGQVPLDVDSVRRLRASTAAAGTLLIFDEVVTGFRWAPGGAQERMGVLPDLTALGKVLGGGLPAGAVAGRADVMELFDVRGEAAWDRHRHVRHYGTFNANPLSAAAGVAALRLIRTGEPGACADRLAAELRAELNGVLRSVGVPGLVYGESSAFHVALGGHDPTHQRMAADLELALRAAMLVRGVDIAGCSGLLSSAHGPAELDSTVAAFRGAVDELCAAGSVAGG